MPQQQPEQQAPPVQRLRVRYAKRGRLRFTSHRDFSRAFERAVFRARVPMAYSSGFNPHPRISYAGAAPTGSASEAEYLELALAEVVVPADVHAMLDDGAVVFVGWTGNLRRRLRQHLAGPRGSSTLHEQVGQLLDTPGTPASSADITDWLSRRTVRWLETDDSRGTAEALSDALMPCFNRRVPKPRSAQGGTKAGAGGKRRSRVSPDQVTTDTGRG